MWSVPICKNESMFVQNEMSKMPKLIGAYVCSERSKMLLYRGLHVKVTKCFFFISPYSKVLRLMVFTSISKELNQKAREKVIRKKSHKNVSDFAFFSVHLL